MRFSFDQSTKRCDAQSTASRRRVLSSPKTFSDVALAYNDHLASLDQARIKFEEDVDSLNELVHARLAERRAWSGEGIRKVRWAKPEPWSTSREGAWQNWISSTRIRLDVRPPNYKNFRRPPHTSTSARAMTTISESSHLDACSRTRTR